MINFIQKPKKRIHHFFIPSEANGHKPHFVRHKALHFYSALLIGVKIFVLVFCFITFPSQAQFSTVTASRIIELTNKARQEEGLPILKESSILDQSALYKAKNMLYENYFAHNSPEGVKPWEWFKKAGYNYTYAGENLAMNFSEAEEVVDAWLSSPMHRLNIMNKNYEEIGIAVVSGKIDGKQTTLVVQHFGKSFITQKVSMFSSPEGKEVKGIAGATLTGGGKATEVTFKEIKHKSIINELIYYAQKFFIILGVFILINLFLTIFIRIKIQHKPIILHSFFVILVALLMLLIKLHFIENIAGSAIVIL